MSNGIARRRPHTPKEMTRNVWSYLYSRQRNPQIIKKYFKAESTLRSYLKWKLFYVPRNNDLGSRMSRSPSPKTLNEMPVKIIAIPGKSVSHGASCI